MTNGKPCRGSMTKALPIDMMTMSSSIGSKAVGAARRTAAKLLIALCCVLVGAGASASTSDNPSRTLQLHSNQGHRVEAERRRPSHLPETVRVAVAREGSVPFNLYRDSGLYEGITADYLHTIQRSGSLRFEIRMFETRSQAYAALASGKVDLIGGIQPEGDRHWLRSLPYFTDREVEVRPLGARRHANVTPAPPARPAVATNELGNADFRARYRREGTTSYPTALSALQAVAYGSADVFIGLATEANYLIDQLQLPLSITRFGDVDAPPFVFLARATDTGLIDRINAALRAIPISTVVEIERRWFGSANHFKLGRDLVLTAEERAYLSTHPAVRYAATIDLPPYLFAEGSRGAVTGLGVDVMDLIGERTGLTFQPVSFGTRRESFEALMDGRVDLLPDIPLGHARPSGMTPTTSYAQTQWVVVVQAGNSAIAGTRHLGGKRVGIMPETRGFQRFDPEPITGAPLLVEGRDVPTLFRMLLDGSVDAISLPCTTANYFIAQSDLARSVEVVTPVNESVTQIAMAVRPDNELLLGIINKVLESTPPEDLDALRHDRMRYRPTNVIAGWSTMQRKRIVTVLMALSVLLSLGGGTLGAIRYRERRHARDMRERIALQDALINALPFSVYLRQADRCIVSCNSSFADAYGLPRDALVGVDVLPTATGRQQALNAMLEKLYRAALTKRRAQFADRTLPGNERDSDVFVWAIPLDCPGSGQDVVLGGWIDITLRKRTERALKQAMLDAKTANQAKSTLLATISHEIRTPMHAILGLLELELNDPGSPGRDAIRTVRKTAQSLLHLINDLLDTSKAEAGELQLDPRPTDVATGLEQPVLIFRTLCAEKGLTLKTDIDPTMPKTLLMDGLRMRQIIGNLLGNALKFTDSGGICLSLRWQPQDDSHGTLDIVVRDTGIGIRAEDKSRLFLPFGQAAGTGVGFGGTGLGLWICRTLVARMGGRIVLESRFGEGTEVRVSIPLMQATPTLSTPATLPIPHDWGHWRRVLVVDDHAPNRMLLVRQLRTLGFESTIEASDGEQALALLEHETVDVILTDCSMSRMSGYAFAGAVRADERWRDLPIFGCSADARAEARALALSAGMTAFLTKPVALADLTHTFNAYLRVATSVDRRALDNADDPQHRAMAAATSRTLCAIASDDSEARDALITALVQSNEADVQALRQAVNGGDADTAAGIAHRIKGGSQIMGAAELEHACVRLEQLLRESDMSGARIQAECVIALCAALHARLRALQRDALE
ncbi:ATP-binding protein [Burkholderia ubonensis]|uniref:ATP-binding protein n=1 Tax=Burkholderia ubonensis TaxID=101571 RepID=UPI0009B3EA00|nr:transporter substrate-binding domain-containing protein [Burkholderia ubonensis]